LPRLVTPSESVSTSLAPPGGARKEWGIPRGREGVRRTDDIVRRPGLKMGG